MADHWVTINGRHVLVHDTNIPKPTEFDRALKRYKKMKEREGKPKRPKKKKPYEGITNYIVKV